MKLSEHQKLIDDLRDFSDRYMRGKLKADQVAKSIPKLMQKPKGHVELLEKWLKDVPESQEQVLAGLLLGLWNTTPMLDQGGKSPNQLLKTHRAKKKGVADPLTSNWIHLQPLMQEIQILFQDDLYKGLKSLAKKQREQALDDIHVAFFRFFHTSNPELLDWPPFLALQEEQKVHKIKLPKNHHLAMRMFRNPELPADPRYNVRTHTGIEPDNDSELARDCSSGHPGAFWADGNYVDILETCLHAQKLAGKTLTGQQLVQILLESQLYIWLAQDDLAQNKFTPRSWYIFWRDILNNPVTEEGDPLGKKWVIDDLFQQYDQRAGIIGTKILTDIDNALMAEGDEAADDILDALDPELFNHDFMGIFNFGCNFFRYLLMPLSLYMPLLKPIWQEPMDVDEEISEFKHQKESFVDWMSKPPAVILPTIYGQQLFAGLADLPTMDSDV